MKFENAGELIKIVGAGLGGVCGYMFGAWDIIFQVLLIFVVVDYVTGVLVAGYNKKLDSKIGFKGIAKKIIIFFMVALAVQLDKLIGTDSHVIRMATCFFYIANEGLSILENGGKLGVRYPSALKKTLEQLKEKSE